VLLQLTANLQSRIELHVLVSGCGGEAEPCRTWKTGDEATLFTLRPRANLLEEGMTSRSTLLLLCGLPFGRKTTLATALVRQLGWRYISLDAINTEHGVGLDGQAITANEWDHTYADAYARVEACLQDRRSVIYDETNFARFQRDRLRAIATGHRATTYIVYLALPESDARKRWLYNRMNRMRGDVRDDDFAYVVQRFEPPASDEATIICHASQSLDEWVELVVRGVAADSSIG
jgi:predicted kinase